ncbi:uncharacterized protein EAF02_009548 [Botrytis sinoallii]|uniref:uncharacterized protein n=1 Tax=Botrytis sinoallii TaxID=1463999 RepID=UPI00190050BB|nr:uncharacterized protein EAF02_009548 [Botrytis sinoallii]KAF7868812.1 hypothetical protein EAF02_009548 [Botrytis sinoallii]
MPPIDDELHERFNLLKQLFGFSIGKIVEEEAVYYIHPYPSKQSLLMEMRLRDVTMDLESFSRHAGRSTITTDDVLLVTRRNDALHDIIKDFIDQEKAKSTNEKGKGRTKTK